VRAPIQSIVLVTRGTVAAACPDRPVYIYHISLIIYLWPEFMAPDKDASRRCTDSFMDLYKIASESTSVEA
jgi:hypothetical protein